MTKKSFSVVKKIKKLIYNSTFVYPLVIKDGQGCYIEDIDGEQYLDFTSNISSSPLGYGLCLYSRPYTNISSKI